MKKSMAMLVTLVLLVPSFCWATGEVRKEYISRITDIDLSKISEYGHLLSTTVDLRMADGKVFPIAVEVDKKNLIATFIFDSGKTFILSPAGMEVVEDEGYQEYDDMDNTISIEPLLSNACLVNLLGFLILPYPLDLIALYYVFMTCF